MIRALMWGLGVGAAIQAFRKWPPDGPVTMDSAVLVFLVGLVLAYFAGKWRARGATATATATAVAAADASATATQTVQVAVIVPHERPEPTVRVPGDSAAWFGGNDRRSIPTADDLEGMDLEDLEQLRDAEGVGG